MKGQTYRMTMLFDFFGDVLTERQQEFFHRYYNEDISLSEIAEQFNITRQGVRDVISRAENTLMDLETKTGLVARFQRNREELFALEQTTEALNIYASQKNDSTLDKFAQDFQAHLVALQKEE